jgi:branched-chain amino acid transport system substrate-binding protein
MKKLSILVCMLSLMMAFTGCQTKEDSKAIKVACNFPMSGDLSFYGQYLQDGITMAMDELKDSMDGQGIAIEYNYEDNHSTTKDAVTAFNKHRLSGFDVYASCCTAQSMAIQDLVDQTKKPNFIWSFYPLSLQPNDNIFRVWIDMAFEGDCFIKYIEQNKPKTVAFVYQNLSSTNEQFNKRIGPAVEKFGVKVVYNESYDTEKKDFKDIITKLSTLKPDIYILYGFQNQLTEIIKNLNAYGLKKDGNILCSFDFLDVQNILDTKLLDGIVTNIPRFIIDDNTRIAKWRNDFEKRFNRKPLFTDAYAYDFAYIMYDAAKDLKKVPGETINEALFKVNRSGISGPLSFDSTGQIKNNIVTCIFKDGDFVEL